MAINSRMREVLVSILPHLVHPRRAVDLPGRITPQRIGHLGGIGQVFNPPDSIGVAVQLQVVIKRTNGTELRRRAGLAALTSTQDHLQMQTSAGLPRAERGRL